MPDLLDLINRKPTPAPWEEGDNIPWDEPGFSERMLAEHLSQEHDAASRRLPKIERQGEWIHSQVLGGGATRVLDLCCGPGLYTSRLAARGHECVGIDFSPAAIAYAKRQAEAGGLACHYLHEDVRQAEFGRGFGLVVMLYGQFNVFRRVEAAAMLDKARQALDAGGTLLLEAHTLEAVERMGAEPNSWYSAASGLFSPRPHCVLEEHFWDAGEKAATTRFFVIDAASGGVVRHAMTTQGYAEEEYRALVEGAGFGGVQLLPSLIGEDDAEEWDFVS